MVVVVVVVDVVVTVPINNRIVGFHVGGIGGERGV